MSQLKSLDSYKIRQNGFSLLEVVITLVVSSIALLGLAAGQLKSLQFSNNSYQYTVSLIQVNNVIEQILNDVCILTGQSFSSTYIEANLKPIDGYTLSWAGITPGELFTSQDITIYINWVDERMDDQSINQVALNASFPTVADGCSVE